MVNSKNNSNFNQALWLGLGQLFTFALSFVSAAILSRYFDKSEYGTYRQILYVYTTLQLLFTMGLPSVFAYFIPRLNQGQQKQLIKGLNRLFIGLGLLFSCALFLLSNPISIWLNNPDLALGIKVFSPFPLFTLPAMGVEGIYTAIRKTKDIAFYHVISKLLMLICMVFPVIYFKTSYIGAIVGWGVASFLTFVYAIHLKNKPYTTIRPELVPNMYKAIFDYSIPLMGAFAFGFAINAADQFYISHYYGTEIFAVFSNGCFSIPIVAMIATSVKNILLPLFSKADANKNFGSIINTYNNAVHECIKLIYPFLVFCVFFANEITLFIYGDKYFESGDYLRLYILRDFIDVFPYLSVLLALGKSRFYMWAHLFGAMYVWVLDYIFVKLGLAPFFIVITASSFQYIVRFVSFVYIKRISGFDFFTWKIIKSLLVIVAHCTICLSLIYYAFKCIFNINSPILIILISLALYYILLIVTGRIIKINYISSMQYLVSNRMHK